MYIDVDASTILYIENLIAPYIFFHYSDFVQVYCICTTKM